MTEKFRTRRQSFDLKKQEEIEETEGKRRDEVRNRAMEKRREEKTKVFLFFFFLYSFAFFFFIDLM